MKRAICFVLGQVAGVASAGVIHTTLTRFVVGVLLNTLAYEFMGVAFKSWRLNLAERLSEKE